LLYVLSVHSVDASQNLVCEPFIFITVTASALNVKVDVKNVGLFREDAQVCNQVDRENTGDNWLDLETAVKISVRFLLAKTFFATRGLN